MTPPRALFWYRFAARVRRSTHGNSAARAGRLGRGGGRCAHDHGVQYERPPRWRVYHVQTEDSGRNQPHVISHLYHGGTILASEKRDYSEHLLEVRPISATLVRGLMDEQHRAMLATARRPATSTP